MFNMTQEEKQLLLKDLCARLPYGVITRNCKNDFDVPAHLLPHINGIKLLIAEYGLKAYLRPKSSMTVEEKKELNKILEYQYCSDDSCMCESNDYLNAHHIDYRGLIPMGLALEAPENMYKITI